MKKNLIIVTVVMLVVKLTLIFAVNHDLTMNQDEAGNYRIAYSHYTGHGYTSVNPVTNERQLTSFHGSFTVFIYEFLIKYNISKEMWVLFVYILSIVLLIISIGYFYKLSLFFLDNERYALYATITYCFYPSVLFYVGALDNWYENLVLPLLVIVVYKLIVAEKNGFKVKDYFILPVAICLSCLFRAQLIAVYSVILLVFSVYILTRKAYKLFPLLIVTVILTIICHIPLLEKNKEMFGEYSLSTQNGFEFLQGHNPTARGSWRNNWRDSTNVLYKYVHAQIKNVNEMNEWEESKARKALAIKWIKENPVSDIKLSFRKLAIYFIPQNFEILYSSRIPNPVNLLTHLFFICFILWKLYRRDFTLNESLILAPILASIFLSIYYFVGYRWRYYAEPFMIIFAWCFLSVLLHRYGKNKVNAEV